MRQRHAESYYDSQLTTDSSGAYDSQSQSMPLSQGSQGESQERRGNFSSNGKRASTMRPPLSGAAGSYSSPSVSVTFACFASMSLASFCLCCKRRCRVFCALCAEHERVHWQAYISKMSNHNAPGPRAPSPVYSFQNFLTISRAPI